MARASSRSADAAAARRDGTPFVDASNRCPATLKRERAEEEAFAAVEDEDEDEEGEEEEEAAAGAGAATAAAAAKGAGATEGGGSAVLPGPAGCGERRRVQRAAVLSSKITEWSCSWPPAPRRSLRKVHAQHMPG